MEILGKIYDRLEKYKLWLNPNKFAFRVTSGKLLGYIVLTCGIEVDPAKVKAIMEIKILVNCVLFKEDINPSEDSLLN